MASLEMQTAAGAAGSIAAAVDNIVFDATSPPPEDLLSIEKCSEKCHFIPDMCNGLYEETSFPSPKCKQWSYTLEEDFYFHKPDELHKRDDQTIELYRWALNQAANIGGPQHACLSTLAKNYHKPMMWPEEFELVTKTMINAKPKTYLEWGSGKSTSFYPLLLHGTENLKAYVIDAYKPWCDKVQNDDTVRCIEPYLTYMCVQPTKDDGVTPISQGALGKTATKEDRQILSNAYINILEQNNVPVKSIDVALVDGRFRLSCALKLLNYLTPGTGILFMHDFWRRKDYHPVLEYYDVIGHARSVAVFRMKSTDKIPKDWANVWEKYTDQEV